MTIDDELMYVPNDDHKLPFCELGLLVDKFGQC